ncbi:MAG: carbohydrate ABC transporter permease [Chloroflexi bacterium CFX4]|nr:carbohydrate ABC transporter permease [Chloroflexi bacterium CFX4]MDL1922461.1 carbohydrate ABC transporter permease [Chloroflexi bacterium CFX3]
MSSISQTVGAEERRAAQARARGYRLRRTLFLTLNYGFMLFLVGFFVFPVVIMVVSSLKPERLVSSDMRTIYAFIPREATLENYTCPDYQSPETKCVDGAGGVFERLPMPRLFFNSVFVTSSIVLLGLFVNSMAAYALARLRLPGRGIVLTLVILLIIVPFESVAVPLLLLVNELPWIDGTISWLNSYHVQIFPFAADAFSIFLFYQFFLNIPRDFDEAARVDGAGGFLIYRRIIVPLARPVFATVAILQFLAHWGSFLWPLMTTRGFEFTTLPVAMNVFFGQAPRQWGDVMAFASLATVPVLVVFLLFQRWFVQSVSASGVKG